MAEYRLRDFTGALPFRQELGQIVSKFHVMSSHGHFWNADHYYLIDNIFLMKSQMAYHYEEYLKQLPSDRERKRFKGLLLNQIVMLMIIHLDKPTPQRHRAETALWHGLQVIRATFIRKYLGSKKNGKLEHMPDFNANMPKYDWTKQQMGKCVSMLYDIVYARAEFLLPKWQKTPDYKENYA